MQPTKQFLIRTGNKGPVCWMMEVALLSNSALAYPAAHRDAHQMGFSLNATTVYVTSSASAFGSRRVASEDVDHAFGMPEGKLKKRAGIVSLAYAAENEDETSLGAQCCLETLQ